MAEQLPSVTQQKAGEIMEAVIARGDIAQLSPAERAKYYTRVCESVGLNPLTQPFAYITLNGKLTLYARKDCTDQLRSIHGVSVTDLAESEREGVFVVTAKVRNRDGRLDAAKGAVNISGLKGEALANALMKAETKAKRRATLSICGLGFLDETEIEDIPDKDKRAMTLPKKDAKDIYVKMQADVDAATSREELKKWCEDRAEGMSTLPEDWQDILRMRIQEKMNDLQVQELNALPAVTVDDDGVIWEEDGERPATPDDVPDAEPPQSDWDNLTPTQQAGILANDRRFQTFVEAANADEAADKIRKVCGVKSRADIKPDGQAHKRWLMMVSAYRAWQVEPSVVDEAPAPAVSDKPPGAADQGAPRSLSNPPGPESGAAEVEIDEGYRLAQLDQSLATAAESGMEALQMQWGSIGPSDRTLLKASLDRRHKPRAQAVDAEAVS